MQTTLFNQIKSSILKNKIYTIGIIGDSISSTEWIHPNRREIVEYVLKSELEIAIKKDIEEKESTLSDDFDGQYLPGETAQSHVWRIPSWNVRFVNLARDGSTTRDWDMQREIRFTKADLDLVILMGTSNDAYFHLPVEEISTNIKDLMRFFEAVYPEITMAIFTSPHGMNTESTALYTPYYKNTVEAFKDYPLFEDLHAAMTALSPAVLSEFYTMKRSDGSIDYSHPNILGNCYIASFVLEKLFGITFDYRKYHQNALSMDYIFPDY